MKTKVREALKLTPEQRKQAQKDKQEKIQESGIARDGRGRWLKGTSGNDLGRPREALSELCRAQITKHGLVGVLGSIAARTGEYGTKKKVEITVGDQIAAIKLLLLYGFGQPKGDIDTGDVKIEVTYADNRSVTIANAAPGANEDHPGEQEVQRRLLRTPIRQDHAGPGSSDPSGFEG